MLRSGLGGVVENGAAVVIINATELLEALYGENPLTARQLRIELASMATDAHRALERFNREEDASEIGS